MKRGGSVYILTNVHNQVLYTGVTSDLIKRVQEHKDKKYAQGFSASYNVDKLVYYENYLTIEEAIAEEKRIEGGSRAKKIKLVKKKILNGKICGKKFLNGKRSINKSRLLRRSSCQ